MILLRNYYIHFYTREERRNSSSRFGLCNGERFTENVTFRPLIEGVSSGDLKHHGNSNYETTQRRKPSKEGQEGSKGGALKFKLLTNLEAKSSFIQPREDTLLREENDGEGTVTQTVNESRWKYTGYVMTSCVDLYRGNHKRWNSEYITSFPVIPKVDYNILILNGTSYILLNI